MRGQHSVVNSISALDPNSLTADSCAAIYIPLRDMGFSDAHIRQGNIFDSIFVTYHELKNVTVAFSFNLEALSVLHISPDDTSAPSVNCCATWMIDNPLTSLPGCQVRVLGWGVRSRHPAGPPTRQGVAPDMRHYISVRKLSLNKVVSQFVSRITIESLPVLDFDDTSL